MENPLTPVVVGNLLEIALGIEEHLVTSELPYSRKKHINFNSFADKNSKNKQFVLPNILTYIEIKFIL